MMSNIEKSTYQELVDTIGVALEQGKLQTVQKVNTVLVATYWQIGQQIVAFEQNGEDRAVYGASLLKNISKDLTAKYGKGFSRSNLQNMRLLYARFPNCQTLSEKLSWSHYTELLGISDDLAFSFYLKQIELENWSVRELKRQIQSSLFERIALSKDKKGVLELSKEGHLPQEAKDIIKDPYVFEFLKIPEKDQWLEKDIEKELINQLGQFLLELGKGFAFIGKQYRITLDNNHFYVDLVFYHRILKCFVLIDLKKGKVNHQDIGQMNLYLNYFETEENTDTDNKPIGIVLGADKNDILVEYATSGITNQLFVSKYKLHLPNKELLKEEVKKLLNQ